MSVELVGGGFRIGDAVRNYLARQRYGELVFPRVEMMTKRRGSSERTKQGAAQAPENASGDRTAVADGADSPGGSESSGGGDEEPPPAPRVGGGRYGRKRTSLKTFVLGVAHNVTAGLILYFLIKTLEATGAVNRLICLMK